MRRRNSVSLCRHIVWLTSSLRTSTKSFGSVTVISPRVNIGDSFVDIATNEALLGQRQANAKQMELEHSDTLQQPPVSVGEPYDGIEFNTRLAALRLIQANIAADEVAAAQQRHNHHQITKRRSNNNNNSETETDDSGAARCSPSSLEFNTVNAMWNVVSRRNSDEHHHHHECDEAAECGSGGSAHASPPVVPATNNRQRQVMHTNTNNNQRSATASSKLKGWQCHICGALFLNSLGDGRRTVCSVCITPRAESSLSSSSLPPSSTSASFEMTWKCEHCTEINEVYVEAANKESEASNLTMMMNFPAAPAHLARSGGGGDIGGDSTGKACRCCGFRRGCPSFSNATFLTAHPPRTSKQISASDISPSMAYMNSAPQFENPDAPFLASSSSSTDNHLPIIERVIDRLIRWHCFTCSFGNLQHTLECAKCGTHKGTTAVVCSHCNLDEDVTIADIVAQRPCPRCHKSLHGAYRKGSTSIWVCTCGTYGKGPTCHRCRAPRTLPTSPPSLARQYTTRTNNLPHHHTTNNNSNTDSTQHVGESSWNTPTLSTASSAFDYVYLTSWACAQCSTVNKASYRQRRRISLMSPQPNRNALRGGGGGGGGETSATTSLGLESERGRDATDSSVEIIRGQLYCGGCRLPWHGAKVSGGQAWRCACHHVNLYNDAATTTATAASGGTSRAAGGRALGSRSNEVAAATNICKSCGRSENITSATTVSFWQPGDWQCQKCFRHNYRRRSKCDCGEHQPF